MHTQAPTLQTARLVLRAHTAADFPRLKAMWTDPRVLKHFGGLNPSHQDCWFRLMRYLGHWPLVGFGYWAVCAEGAYIGDVGLANFQRRLGPRFDDAPEIGWVLAPEAFGQGYATEAARAVLVWLENTFGPTRTVCLIADANIGSIQVARKLGYTPFGTDLSGVDLTTLYERVV
jgi:RimJ/RimL family protein N-acetyltransferase